MSACTICINPTTDDDGALCSACYAVAHLAELHAEGRHEVSGPWDECEACEREERERDIDPRWLDSDDARDQREDR